MLHKRIRYPDGQISAKIGLTEAPLDIHERINNYEDLFYVVSIAEALRHQGYRNYHLQIPCLLGQRSDRRFEANQSFDLKVICDLINSYKFLTVSVLDPHSDVCIALLHRSVKISPFPFVERAVRDLSNYNLALISPDAGAYKKVFTTAEYLKLPLMAAVKYRDDNGKVSMQFTGNVKGKACLIVDDLADGGYTFHKLAEELKHEGATQVFLYVTHGQFNKGFDQLKEHIDHIYCTNSYRDIEEEPFVTQYKVI